MDLVHLSDDDGNSCVVRISGRFQPGVLTGHDILRADVLVSASFVDARLTLYLLPQDLDDWQRSLSELAPGRESVIGGEVGVRPAVNWISEHFERLEQARLTWPREVLEAAPGAYEWDPATLLGHERFRDQQP